MMANGAYKPADSICEEIEKLGKDHVVAVSSLFTTRFVTEAEKLQMLIPIYSS